ncbi:MAG: hypothetical protein Kow00107_07210 [Planctomycetota bacterium]
MADRIMPCPGCGKNYNISTFKPGMKFRCTQCGKTVVVPGAEPAREEPHAPRRDRDRMAASPAGARPSRSKRRRQYDEDEMERDPRSRPRRKDNTAMIAIFGAVGVVLIILLITAFVGAGSLNPTLPPLDATPSNFTGSYGLPKTADWSKSFTPEPKPTVTDSEGNPIPVDTSTAQTGTTEKSPEPAVSGVKPPLKDVYIELSECSQELQDFVAQAVERYGGMEALKFNKTFQAEVMKKSNLQRDRNVDENDPLAPFTWKAETEYSQTLWWKRSGTVNKMGTSMIQSSIRITTLWDGKVLRKFIDKNSSTGDEAAKQRFANDAYDFDIMYKLGNGQYRFLNKLSKGKQRFDPSKIICDTIKVQDRLTGRIMQISFYNDDLYADWKGLPFAIMYDDEYNKETVKKYFWNYYEKNKQFLPFMTLTARYKMNAEGKVSPDTLPSVEMDQILKENDEELGEIKMGHDIDDIWFEKPRD